MPVTYTKVLRQRAADGNLHLVTLAAGGVAFQDAVPEDQRDELVRLVLDYLERRRAAGRSKDKPAGGES